MPWIMFLHLMAQVHQNLIINLGDPDVLLAISLIKEIFTDEEEEQEESEEFSIEEFDQE